MPTIRPAGDTPVIHFDAVLLEHTGSTAPRFGSWFITHGLGKPAARTYTEVVFPDPHHPEEVLEQVVRTVAMRLYGDTWASGYRPDQYADTITRYGLRLRERVLVSGIEVWS